MQKKSKTKNVFSAELFFIIVILSSWHLYPTRFVPALKSVGKSVLVFSNKALQTMDLQFLQTIGADFHLASNDELQTVSAPVLQTIENRFSIYGNKQLHSVLAPLVNEIGKDLIIKDNKALKTLHLDNLQHVEEVKQWKPETSTNLSTVFAYILKRKPQIE